MWVMLVAAARRPPLQLLLPFNTPTHARTNIKHGASPNSNACEPFGTLVPAMHAARDGKGAAHEVQSEQFGRASPDPSWTPPALGDLEVTRGRESAGWPAAAHSARVWQAAAACLLDASKPTAQ